MCSHTWTPLQVEGKGSFTRPYRCVAWQKKRPGNASIRPLQIVCGIRARQALAVAPQPPESNLNKNSAPERAFAKRKSTKNKNTFWESKGMGEGGPRPFCKQAKSLYKNSPGTTNEVSLADEDVVHTERILNETLLAARNVFGNLIIEKSKKYFFVFFW